MLYKYFIHDIYCPQLVFVAYVETSLLTFWGSEREEIKAEVKQTDTEKGGEMGS